MKKYAFPLLLIITLLSIKTNAQKATGFKWWDPAQNSFGVMQNGSWTGETATIYNRFPVSAEKSVNKAVWNLSKNAAGLAIDFKTNANQIIVRFVVKNKLEMPHMPATGVSGIDLYATDKDGQWQWMPGKYSFGDTVTYQFSNIETDKFYLANQRRYHLYLPLYNTVSAMQIGVPDSASFEPYPFRMEKPVVVYGTSIAQGACASRPGMAWTAQLERRLDRPVINLGFSGSGKLEKEVVQLVSEIDAKVYVIDCLPNITGQNNFKTADVTKLVVRAAKLIRDKHPETPIIFTEHADANIGLLDTLKKRWYNDANQGLQLAIKQLANEHIKNIYVLTARQINLDDNCTVDGLHPNDTGMERYAIAYENLIRKVIFEPTGKLSTQKPKRQYRDAKTYDWMERHTAILKLDQAKPPQSVIIGNSIIHYWGGSPVASVRRGEDSWEQLLEPKGLRNYGFGWDMIENALWRIYHDELDGFKAKHIVIMIGTNNLGVNTDAEITDGIKFLAEAVIKRQPKAKISLLGIFPRKGMEVRILNLNKMIANYASTVHLGFADPGKLLLNNNGKIQENLFVDGLHPNAAGYRKLATTIANLLK